MEPWTSGVVSHLARAGWHADPLRAARDRAFEPLGRGRYRMIGWQSEISIARAYGRGAAAGREIPVRPEDRED
jgi:hypothetical protein